MRRALVKALLSHVPTASAAAAEAIAHLAAEEQFRHWLMSGRGETAPSVLLQQMVGFAVSGPVVKAKAAPVQEVVVEEAVVEKAAEAPSPPAKAVKVEPAAAAAPPTDDEVVGDLVKLAINKTTGKTAQDAKAKAESLKAMKAIDMDALRSLVPSTKALALQKTTTPAEPLVNQISRTAMLSSWVSSENKAQLLVNDFGPAPVEEDEDANVVWSGYNWTIHGASGVIGQVLKHLVYDERMLERLQRLDTSVAVAQTVVHSLVQLAATTKEGETGAKYAADALEHITKKGYGLMYMSVLGEEGIAQLVAAMRDAGAQIKNSSIKQKVLGALKRLEDAQPKKK